MKLFAPLLIVGVSLLCYYFYPALAPHRPRHFSTFHPREKPQPTLVAAKSTAPNSLSTQEDAAAQPEQQDDSSRKNLSTATAEWLRGRDNIFFNEDHFIGDLLQRDQEIISALGERLRDLDPLLAVAHLEEIVSATPEVVRERMAVLDMISGILTSTDVAEDNKQALIAELQTFIHQAIVTSYSAFAKKVLITEKREALQQIAAHNPAQAREIWQQIPQDAVKTLLDK
jgi:hypothetical protein